MKLAYVVQLELPGYPVKCGSSSNPFTRMQHFRNSTPCAIRLVGCTLQGIARETEMLDATADKVIRGEWRYPTAALRNLLKEWHLAGQWFVEADDKLAHVRASKVKERVAAVCPARAKLSVSPASCGYAWARHVLSLAHRTDPMLGVDWAGLVRSQTAPSLDWPTPEARAA